MHILVVDPDRETATQVHRIVNEGVPEVKVDYAATAELAINAIRKDPPTVVVTEAALPDLEGTGLAKKIRNLSPQTLIIFLTGVQESGMIIEASKADAFAYLLKPVDENLLREKLQLAFRISNGHAATQASPEARELMPGELIVASEPMRQICMKIGRIAPLDTPVLIRGETGTGKELVAKAIHHNSRRNQAPFMAINCAAIPESLLESELFGHEKGSFTGAIERRIGKFEQCSGGTIFLDEIGDMPGLLQSKILRVLQEQRFERVGGNETIQTNVRILAATNQPLEARVEEQRFRLDLLYRLNTTTITLPPLRDRREEIPVLARYFFAAAVSEMKSSLRVLPEETIKALTQHPWHGNVRELQGIIKQAVIAAHGRVLLLDFLPTEISQSTGA